MLVGTGGFLPKLFTECFHGMNAWGVEFFAC
jgi:hypothetical protein